MTQSPDDSRDLMLLAIEQMQQSIHEARADGKPTPSVGAVLVKPDGTRETAFRGELRDGDHASKAIVLVHHRR